MNAQFIIISLRNNMFELADRLVGVRAFLATAGRGFGTNINTENKKQKIQMDKSSKIKSPSIIHKVSFILNVSPSNKAVGNARAERVFNRAL